MGSVRRSEVASSAVSGCECEKTAMGCEFHGVCMTRDVLPTIANKKNQLCFSSLLFMVFNVAYVVMEKVTDWTYGWTILPNLLTKEYTHHIGDVWFVASAFFFVLVPVCIRLKSSLANVVFCLLQLRCFRSKI